MYTCGCAMPVGEAVSSPAVVEAGEVERTALDASTDASTMVVAELIQNPNQTRIGLLVGALPRLVRRKIISGQTALPKIADTTLAAAPPPASATAQPVGMSSMSLFQSRCRR